MRCWIGYPHTADEAQGNKTGAKKARQVSSPA